MPIKVKCITYLSDFQNEEWPTEMVARPIKGDLVRSKDGKILIVRSITHTGNYEVLKVQPILEVLLTR